jgi:hypothetical protein
LPHNFVSQEVSCLSRRFPCLEISPSHYYPEVLIFQQVSSCQKCFLVQKFSLVQKFPFSRKFPIFQASSPCLEISSSPKDLLIVQKFPLSRKLSPFPKVFSLSCRSTFIIYSDNLACLSLSFFVYASTSLPLSAASSTGGFFALEDVSQFVTGEGK